MVQQFLCCICSLPGTVREHPYLGGQYYFCDEHYQFLAEGYQSEIEAPFLYVRCPAERPDTDSPVIGFYEYHGKWCLRRVNQFDGNSYRAARNGRHWAGADAPLDIDTLNRVGFRKIPKSEFEKHWDAASEDPRIF